MRRPEFKDNSRETRASDLFKYLLKKEKEMAIRIAQKNTIKRSLMDLGGLT